MTATIKIRDPDTRADLSRDIRTKQEYDAVHDELMAFASKMYFALPDDGREADSSCEGFLKVIQAALIDQFSREQWEAWKSL